MPPNVSSLQDQLASETAPLLGGPSPEHRGDVEQQASRSDASKHQGLPEVRKRMKYIFPAIAIGVSLEHSFKTCLQPMNIDTANKYAPGLPISSRPNTRGNHLWHHRHRPARSVLNLLDRNRLLPHALRLPTSLRQALRHLWPQAMSSLSVPHFRHRLCRMWSCKNDRRACCSEGFCRHRRRRNECVH